MLMKRSTHLIVAASAAALFIGGSFAAGQNSKSTPATTNQQQQESLTGENIEKAVQQKLKRLDGVDTSKLEIEASDRTVTVTGTVNSLLESDRIMEAISAVRGVNNVMTHFTVEPEKRADREIQQDVRDALVFDPVTSDAKTTVAVNNGVVTLTGEAKTWPEKQLAAWLASDVRGVREVRNNLTVATSDRPDDQIKQAIERRFMTDPLVSDNISVKVANGRVSLSGEVRSALEKRWAITDARTLGVRDVDASALRVNPDAPSADSRQARRPDDNEIKNAITSAFLYDPRVFSFNPNVEVKGGVVTLSGSVSNLKAKQAAVQLAENTAGVNEVKDNLEVRPAPRSDDQIAHDLRRAYNRSALVDANQINVRVENGRAVLSGVVDSNFEKWGAADIAARTRGVTEVDNKLVTDDVPQVAVAPGGYYYYPWHSSYSAWTYSPADEPKSDAALLSDVRSHLFWSPFTDAEDITVAVDNGVVTLSGEVDNRLEKGAAEDNAYQAGARRVENRLFVIEPTGR